MIVSQITMKGVDIMFATYLLTVTKKGKLVKKILKHGKHASFKKYVELENEYANDPDVEVTWERLKDLFE